MLKIIRVFQIVSAITFLSALMPGLYADQFGVDFSNTSGATSLGNPPFTLGWEFTVSTTIQVNELAFYDDGENGLADSHEIGIWNSSGTLVASGTVLAGTASPLVDQFREVAVSATLGAGDYFIGALFVDGNDPVWFPGSSLTDFSSAPGITYDGATFAGGGSLADPTTADSSPGFFGADFSFSSTPEPSSVALLGTLLVAVLFAFRKLAAAR